MTFNNWFHEKAQHLSYWLAGSWIGFWIILGFGLLVFHYRGWV